MTAKNSNNQQALLQMKDLSVRFRLEEGHVYAVDGVSFDLFPGEILGIVGESGSGKSVSTSAILQLLPKYIAEIESQGIWFKGERIDTYTEKEMAKIRGDQISIIFQEPMTSLNPVMSIGKQIAEVLLLHNKANKKEAWQKAIDLLAEVGVPDPEEKVNQYPHEFSGGMAQRVLIAIALACEPDVIIADEPTTALDVTIQDQILNLLKEIQRKVQNSVILITHDLAVIAETADRVIVMYAGQIVEIGSVEEIFNQPAHPYTRGLLNSIPVMGRKNTDLKAIDGNISSMSTLPVGCHFAERCPFATERCRKEKPDLETVSLPNTVEHKSRCWLNNQLSPYVKPS